MAVKFLKEVDQNATITKRGIMLTLQWKSKRNTLYDIYTIKFFNDNGIVTTLANNQVRNQFMTIDIDHDLVMKRKECFKSKAYLMKSNDHYYMSDREAVLYVHIDQVEGFDYYTEEETTKVGTRTNHFITIQDVTFYSKADNHYNFNKQKQHVINQLHDKINEIKNIDNIDDLNDRIKYIHITTLS